MNFCVIFSLLVCVTVNSGLVTITDDELKAFSEELLKKDSSNSSAYVTVRLQGKTNAGSTTDVAPLPLLEVKSQVKQTPTVSHLIALYDNYDPDTSHSEVITTGERKEESDFLDAVLNTQVMSYTNSFLKQKGFTQGTKQSLKDLLNRIWFTVYSRGQRKMGSSAFEHIFVGEIKREEISGLHNWLFFAHEEEKKRLNYLGWMRVVDFGGKGGILKLHYTWNGKTKPVGTMFVGTNPELELALYTVCFLARPNDKCNLSMNGKDVFVQTYTFTSHNQRLIGSAFPGISTS